MVQHIERIGASAHSAKILWTDKNTEVKAASPVETQPLYYTILLEATVGDIEELSTHRMPPQPVQPLKSKKRQRGKTTGSMEQAKALMYAKALR